MKEELKMSSSGKKTSVTFNPYTCTHIVNYDGKSIETTVTDKRNVAYDWVTKYGEKKGKVTVVGLAMEFNQDKAKPATLQLYIDGKCLILQLFHMDRIFVSHSHSHSLSFSMFFKNSMFIFAGIEVEKSNDVLCKLFSPARKTLDIMEAARMRWPEKFSKDTDLQVLTSEVANLHIDLPEHVLHSKWDATVLCLEQVEYACMEAFASFCVAHKLLIGD